MLEYLDRRISGLGWSKDGGDATFRSYGVAPPREESRTVWAARRDAFRAAMPQTHRVFLERLQLSVAQDSLLFVHAGIRPGVPLDLEDKRDLLWIRSESCRPSGTINDWLCTAIRLKKEA